MANRNQRRAAAAAKSAPAKQQAQPSLPPTHVAVPIQLLQDVGKYLKMPHDFDASLMFLQALERCPAISLPEAPPPAAPAADQPSA